MKMKTLIFLVSLLVLISFQSSLSYAQTGPPPGCQLIPEGEYCGCLINIYDWQRWDRRDGSSPHPYNQTPTFFPPSVIPEAMCQSTSNFLMQKLRTPSTCGNGIVGTNEQCDGDPAPCYSTEEPLGTQHYCDETCHCITYIGEPPE